jgi:hypothetical protein
LQVQQQVASTGRKRCAENDNDDAELALSLAKRRKSFGIADFDEGIAEPCAHASQDMADAELLAVRVAIREAFAVDDDDDEEEAIEAAPAQPLISAMAASRAPLSSQHVQKVAKPEHQACCSHLVCLVPVAFDTCQSGWVDTYVKQRRGQEGPT